MKTKSFFQLVIQLCGLYYIYLAIKDLVLYFTFLSMQSGQPMYGDESIMTSQLIVLAIHLLIGLVLLFVAKKITALLLRSEDDADITGVSKADIVEIVLIVAGIITIFSSIPSAYTKYAVFEDNPSALAHGIIALVASAIVIWNARPISKFIMKINVIDKDEDRQE